MSSLSLKTVKAQNYTVSHIDSFMELEKYVFSNEC